jgi:hypothetical protein
MVVCVWTCLSKDFWLVLSELPFFLLVADCRGGLAITGVFDVTITADVRVP